MRYIPAKSILQKAGGGWFGADYNVNLYRGCCHGCIYCDSRSDVYGIENFDQVTAKQDALQILEQELRTKRKKGVVGFGSMSDPYNPFEKKEGLTRGALALIVKQGFGATVTTKSDLLLRDIDLFLQIQQRMAMLVKITLTTMDEALAQKIEPLAPSPAKRAAALKVLGDRGIYTGVLLMPVLPFITDNWDGIETLIRTAADAGARFVYPGLGVTLRSNQRAYYLDRVANLFPGMEQRYIKAFGLEYACGAENAQGLYEKVAVLCEKLGLLYELADIVSGYQAPYQTQQISLF